MSTQPEPNAAYNAEVKRIAEVLAFFRYKRETYFGASFTEEDKRKSWDGFECKESYIKGKSEEARAMVSEMNVWYLQGISDAEAKSEITLLGDSEVSDLQKEYGLIPNTKTDNDA